MRRFLPFAILFVALWQAGTMSALELKLPGNGTLTREIVRNPDSYLLPVGVWSDGALPSLEVKGRVAQQAWRIEASGITTLQLIEPLINQLNGDGFVVILDCVSQKCGGFDFRFGTTVMSAPDMFVDLLNYRFVSARADRENGAEYVTLLVSRSANTGYVQIIHVAPEGIAPPKVDPSAAQRPVARPDNGQDRTSVAAPATPIEQALETKGHVVLDDLEFKTGSSALGEGPYKTLSDLARFLKSDTSIRMALVGHTDSVGSLDANILLSRKRAAAVLERLVGTYGVSRSQLEAGGMGYLSPIASNLTAAGRDANRRVEAVLLNSE